jgi:hypothetical protein
MTTLQDCLSLLRLPAGDTRGIGPEMVQEGDDCLLCGVRWWPRMVWLFGSPLRVIPPMIRPSPADTMAHAGFRGTVNIGAADGQDKKTLARLDAVASK